jgi:enoyl-CoA hydratase/carnithine racemase
MMTPVNVAIEAGVATVTVTNPPVNALGDTVLEALFDAAERLRDDAGVRAVVLTGAGERTFIAGADLGAFMHALGDAEEMRAHVQLTTRTFGAWASMPAPVIAAIGGHAMGGGLELALLCDVLVADPRAKLGLPEVTLGLMPGAGGTQLLPRRVGVGRAARMILLGEVLDAEAALAAGLIDAIAAPGAALPDALAIAARLTALPGRAVCSAKAALRTAASQPLEEGLARERRLFLELAATADALEGTTAFISKRPPTFTHS